MSYERLTCSPQETIPHNFIHRLQLTHPPTPSIYVRTTRHLPPPPATNFHSSTRDPPQPTRPFTRKDAHDAEADVKEAERVRDQPAHAAHAADGAEHFAAAVRAPADGEGADDVAGGGVHGQDDADEARQDEREEAVAQDAGAAGERQRAARQGVHAVVVRRLLRCVRRGRGRVAAAFGGEVVGGGRHEGEDCVEGEGADEGEAVDVAEVDLAREEEEGAEEEEEEDRPRQVRVVHDVLRDGVQRVQDRERLFFGDNDRMFN